MGARMLALLACLTISLTGAAAAGERDAGERLDNLERQIAEMKAQNDRLIELLSGGQQAAPATPAARPAAAPAAAKAPAPKVPAQFSPGWVARIYDLPEGFDVKSGLPPLELGFFNLNKSQFTYGDFQEALGMNVQSGVLWRGEAFLNVTAPGTHAITINYNAGYDPTWVAIFIEGKMIAEKFADGRNTVIGGVNLQPGVYKTEFRIANNLDRRSMLPLGGYNSRMPIEIFVKTPSDSKPRPAHEVFLRQ